MQKSLRVLQMPGFDVRQDGDVIRIAIPSDQLFQPGSAQLRNGAHQLIDTVGTAVARSYPRQIISVEAYTDSGPVGGGYASRHQLTANQAMAVLDQLTRQNRLSDRQLFMVAQGANHPRASNATSAGQAQNRRVELVVYPETIDGR